LTNNPLIYSVSYFSFGGFVAFLGDQAHQNPCGDGTGYQQTSISKTVLPNYASCDIGLLDAQQWLPRLVLNGYCGEQLHSVQLLPSCSGAASPKILGGPKCFIL